MLDLVFGEVSFTGEYSLHLFSTPDHKPSISDKSNILLEFWGDDLGYLFDESIAVWWQLWADIKGILVDGHIHLFELYFVDVRVKAGGLGVERGLDHSSIFLARQKLKSEIVCLHLYDANIPR